MARRGHTFRVARWRGRGKKGVREREGEGYDGRATRERNKRPLSIVCLGEVEQRTPIREGGRKQERGGGVQGFRIKSRES